jgi:hypothetical protein
MGFIFVSLLLLLTINHNICDAINFSIDTSFCVSVNDCSNLDQICFNNSCKCGLNYRWNSTGRICEYFNFNEDIDCQEFDENQIWSLSNNCCVCNETNTRNTSTNLCFSIKETVSTTVENWIINKTLGLECNSTHFL